jgi:dihydrofolate reductase
MTKVYTGASMSLDGYIAGPAETGFEHLFKWYGNGDVEVPTAQQDASFSFVTDGIQAAIDQAKALAGDKVVGVNGGTIASQCLNAGLLDEIWVDLVPLLLGGGTRFFDQLQAAPVELEGPTSVVEDIDVTHLRYRVRYR